MGPAGRWPCMEREMTWDLQTAQSEGGMLILWGSIGIENRVVDSARIEAQHRHRRAKTDRRDVHKLLTTLLRHHAGG